MLGPEPLLELGAWNQDISEQLKAPYTLIPRLCGEPVSSVGVSRKAQADAARVRPLSLGVFPFSWGGGNESSAKGCFRAGQAGVAPNVSRDGSDLRFLLAFESGRDESRGARVYDR